MAPARDANEVNCASPYLSILLSSCPIVFSHPSRRVSNLIEAVAYETHVPVCLTYLPFRDTDAGWGFPNTHCPLSSNLGLQVLLTRATSVVEVKRILVSRAINSLTQRTLPQRRACSRSVLCSWRLRDLFADFRPLRPWVCSVVPSRELPLDPRPCLTPYSASDDTTHCCGAATICLPPHRLYIWLWYHVRHFPIC